MEGNDKNINFILLTLGNLFNNDIKNEEDEN